VRSLAGAHRSKDRFYCFQGRSPGGCSLGSNLDAVRVFQFFRRLLGSQHSAVSSWTNFGSRKILTDLLCIRQRFLHSFGALPENYTAPFALSSTRNT
jgi:hypothetical protein